MALIRLVCVCVCVLSQMAPRGFSLILFSSGIRPLALSINSFRSNIQIKSLSSIWAIGPNPRRKSSTSERPSPCACMGFLFEKLKVFWRQIDKTLYALSFRYFLYQKEETRKPSWNQLHIIAVMTTAVCLQQRQRSLRGEKEQRSITTLKSTASCHGFKHMWTMRDRLLWKLLSLSSASCFRHFLHHHPWELLPGVSGEVSLSVFKGSGLHFLAALPQVALQSEGNVSSQSHLLNMEALASTPKAWTIFTT